MKILYSITVHEGIEFLELQVFNIKKYNPNSGIIIHISSNLNLSENDVGVLERISKLDQVFINPNRIPTFMFKIASPQILNVLFAKNIVYDYFCMLASNEMFFRNGAEDYIFKYEAGSFHLPSNVDLLLLEKHQDAINFAKFLSESDQTYTGQHEGTFYKKEIIEKIVEKILVFKPLNELHLLGDTTEEWIFPTALHLMYKNIKLGYPITFLRDRAPEIMGTDYENNMDKTKKFITNLIENESYDGSYVVQKPIESIFSIKRVPRNSHGNLLKEYIFSL